MKKLTAVLLSLILALSLAVPALAAPAPDAAPADGVYTVDGEPVPTYTPGEAIPISAILPEATNDAALGIIGGADGPTAIFTTSPVDWGVVLNESYMNSDTAIEWFKAKHPERVEALRSSAKDYFTQEYGEYWTVQEYLEDMDLTEEQFLDEMVEEQLLRLYFDEGSQWIADMQKEAMGGVVGQIGVMVNGTYVQFPDAIPEVTNGRTMVPVRALVEALGGEVDYQDDVVTFTIGGYAYEFAIGSTTVKVSATADNDKDTPKPEDIEMDCAPYLKGGRTYVPVRFISEALGYEVGWDSAYQTAVLLDREALAAQIDEDFTILNKVQANKSVGMEEGKNYRADAKGNISLTLFDTLNGNKTYKADLTAKQLFNTDAASASLSLKLSDNVMDELIKYLISSNSPEEDIAAVREQMEKVLDTLEDVEIILTREGSAWFRTPLLDELAGEDNVWLDADLGAEWGELAFTQVGDATIGTVLAYMADKDSAPYYQSVLGMAEMLADIYGDDKFTTSGGTSTLTIDLDSLMELYEDMGIDMGEAVEEVKAAFKEYKIVMKVDSKGGAVMTCAMETNPQSGVPGMKITMDVTQSGGNVSMTMSYHIANMGEMKLTLTQTQKATSDKPMTQPPEGATLVDMDNGAELLVP